ncbi:MAG: WYL domain-containing transcriptional regulator [Deltaproteobacteria bacterium]|nr:WYL domain-containing transcriptional regulator [Deltaproteobacteria bacterium]
MVKPMWSVLATLVNIIDIFLESNGVTAYEIATRLGMSEKTVKNYIDYLTKSNFMIYQEDDRDSDNRIVYKYDKTETGMVDLLKLPVPFTTKEIMALYFLRGNIRQYKGTEIETHINTFFKKLNYLLPKGLDKQMKAIEYIIIPTSKFVKDYSTKIEIIRLTKSIITKHTSLIEYHSFHDDRFKSFKIDPLHFFEQNGGLYIWVRATSSDKILTLAVERISKVSVSNDHFQYPVDFQPEAELEKAFNLIMEDPIKFKIRFSADVAKYVKERVWAKNQVITSNSDGSIIFEMETSGWVEVEKWILSYGPDAELLEPEEKRTELLKTIKEVTLKYIG